MADFETGIIDRFEGDFAVIKFADGRELLWPVKLISWSVGEGEAVNVFLSKNNPESLKKENEAKNILQTIFQTNNA